MTRPTAPRPVTAAVRLAVVGVSAAVVVFAVVVSAVVGAPALAEQAGEPERAFRIADPAIDESSGLAASAGLPGVVWTVDDSGGAPTVYGLDGRGRTVATVTVDGATNRDWEALAVGPRPGGGSWLWVGDIGDNLSAWDTVRVYRVREPTTRGRTAAKAQAYELGYPDGPRDAEALLVDPRDGRLYVVSKRVQGAAVYRAPRVLRTDRVNRLTRVAAAPPLVTDGTVAPDGRVALRDYVQAWLSDGVSGPRTRVPLPVQPQGESLTWAPGAVALLAGSEGARSVVWRVPLSGPQPSGATPTVSGSTPEPAAAAGEDGRAPRSPWPVVVAGLLVGGAAAAVLRLASRRRGNGSPSPG